MLIDSHCHLDDPRFDPDREEVLTRALAAGVGAFLVAGYDEARWRRGLALAEARPEVALAAGLHPWAIGAGLEHRVSHPSVPCLHCCPENLSQSRRAAEETQEAHTRGMQDGPGDVPGSGEGEEFWGWLEQAAEHPACCALGETGLDAARAGQAGLKAQEQVLVGMLRLARHTGLPLILHVVRAHARVLALLKEAGPLPGGVAHSFAGSPEEAAAYLRQGFHLGLGTAATRVAPGRLARVVALCPAGWFLLETDAPDRPVHSRSGTRGEPADLVEVAAAVARLRGESAEQVAEESTAATRRLFRRAPWGEDRRKA